MQIKCRKVKENVTDRDHSIKQKFKNKEKKNEKVRK